LSRGNKLLSGQPFLSVESTHFLIKTRKNLTVQSSDKYKTIQGPAEGLYKEKGSRFIALAFPVETEQEAKEHLLKVKKEYHDARHHCYAFRICPENEFFRSSDDGEPSGTAGKPILNQIFSKELFNVLVVVVRYFGGTKLGVPGLIKAYQTATQEALAHAVIVTRAITRRVEIAFDYQAMNRVMRVIKEEEPEVTERNFDTRCSMVVQVEKNKEKYLLEKLKRINGLTVK
jgi:uncharacterized YigZ family protein